MNQPSDFEPLIHSYLDGTLTREQMDQLNAILRTDENARREFADFMNLDSAIAATAAGWVSEKTVSPEIRVARHKLISFPTAVRWLAAAACVALLGLGGAWWQTTSGVYATVQKGAGVEELANGSKLRNERYAIKAGTVELVTAHGARIVIEAPAEFSFESAQRLRMLSGRLAADVPPAAKGFTVVTPTGDAVDLGTRFGVDVPASGAAEIHVFQGEVIAKTSGTTASQSLRKGDALTMNQGSSSTREFRSSAFIQPDEMTELTAGLAAGQRARSEAALTLLRKDPALIALLDFEKEESYPGVFRTVQGRWPGSRAPEFVNIGDHLKLDVGGEHEWPQLTLATWVRIDRLGAPYQSLLHTDGWSMENPGQAHWMITQKTTMRLALIGNTMGSNEHDPFPDSRTPVLPEQGRWVHLAAVYDAAARTVRFYLNGQFDKETRLEVALPARLGHAQIGNWDQKDRKLSGRIDEFLLLGRAMTDAEVHALFAAGNPYR